MPLPPIHGLAILSPYFKGKALFDPLALVASATFVDLEPLFYIIAGQPLDHQMWHGYALALTVYPVLIGLFVYLMERFLEGNVRSAYDTMGFKPSRVRYSPLTIYLCCLVGGLSHIFLDMFTHQSMPYAIYPLAYGNPFYLGQFSSVVEIAASALAVLSIFLWLSNAKTSHPKKGLKVNRRLKSIENSVSTKK